MGNSSRCRGGQQSSSADRRTGLVIQAWLVFLPGFNQAALLAEWLSSHLSVDFRPTLERIHYTTTQTAFDRAERMRNLRGAFRLRKKADVRDLRVLLIDDVLTTGSTLSECARVLKEAGAHSIHAATAARA